MALYPFVVACDGPRHTEEFRHSYPLAPGGRISVENFNGSIEITSWNENTVEISGAKYAGSKELLAAMRIDITAAPDSLSVRTVRPSGHRGNMGARYVIRVPRKVELSRVITSNGSIRVTDVEGAARLKTSNGTVRAEGLRGSLDAETSNGGIEVARQEGGAALRTSNGSVGLSFAGGSDDIKISTRNGGITLRLPERIEARLVAATRNGRVTSDFEVAGQGAGGKHRLEGMLGSGSGRTIDLSTTNGDIRILRQ